MNDTLLYLLGAVIILGIVIVCVLAVYYRKSMKHMEEILAAFERRDRNKWNGLKETRESKLEGKLEKILSQVIRDQERAYQERDQVAALLSDLSHQLKTPLANIRMYTELLGEEQISLQERGRFSKEAQAQVEKMEWLMKTLLKASRLEQGMISFHAQYEGIKKTIAQAVGGVFAQADKKRIRIVTEEFSDKKLYHNPKWTVEAIENILENAVKYSPEGSVVTIRLVPMEIYSRIEIQDQGIGMEPEEYNEIFKRFYRGKQVQQQEGSGLGLYLAQLILNHEKGYITVSSQVGAGSCFLIYLLNPK
ncbi:MAG: HAMP domain-containing sensor histidine kinase [Eubacteriales bacterium]|nr:HAMP domain-containing sensor histidine kinase [Eubacteriales bacterium]